MKHLKENEMPLNYILEVEVFNLWDIDFMGQFPSFHDNKCIVVAIDHVSKWMEIISCQGVAINIKRNNLVFIFVEGMG